MIDVSRIRSLDKLKEMKDDLNFFINKKIIADIYKEQDIEDELEYDRDMARNVLAEVLKQIDRLNRSVKKKDLVPRPSETSTGSLAT